MTIRNKILAGAAALAIALAPLAANADGFAYGPAPGPGYGPPAYALPAPVITPMVMWAQNVLNAGGYFVNPDGIMGPETASALAHFQATHGLYADGVLGPQTISVLIAVAPQMPPPAYLPPA